MSRGIHTHDHELKIGTTTRQLDLIRDKDGAAMYQVIEDVPNYDAQLSLPQTSFIGGHGQHDFKVTDMYFEGQSIDTTQEGRVCLGPEITEVQEHGTPDTDLDSAPVCFLWFGAASKWLVATSGEIYLYDSTDNDWDEATTEVANVTDMVEFNGVAYAAVGSGTKYYYSANGDTWTQTDLSDGYAQKFFVSPNTAGTSNVLWKWKGSSYPNELANTTDGRTVAAGGVQWSSAAYIGDKTSNITNIFLAANKLFIGREDGLFWYDESGGVHSEMDDLKHNKSSNNFKYVTQWQTCAYFSLGTGLGEVMGSQYFDPMGPLTKIDDIGKVGVCVGLSSDKDYIYAAMDEGTNSIIYKGREVRKDGALRWEWCPWVFLGTETCATAKVCDHSATDRRLWFGYGNSTAYVILTDNPTADSAARFCTSGFLRMSYHYGNNKYWDKLLQSAILDVKGGDTGETVQVKYRKDTDTGDGTECIAAAATNGIFETNFSSALNCKRIQFELHLASDTNTATPEVLYFEAKGVEKPTTVRVHEAVYAIGDEPSKRVKTIRTFLRGGRTSTSLIRFADLRYGETTGGTAGTDFVYVVMMPGFPQEVEIFQGKGRQPSLGLKCRWQEVSFT